MSAIRMQVHIEFFYKLKGTGNQFSSMRLISLFFTMNSLE
jgi:hypothetical protein